MALELLALESDEVRLQLLPSVGGRMHSLDAFGVELLRAPDDVERHVAEPFYWGSYPLVPWSNRIVDARLVFRGTAHQLRANFSGGFAIHGEAYEAAWTVVESGERVRLGFEGRSYPWPYRAEQVFTVAGRTLVNELSVTNLAGVDMPAGLGIHPWFSAAGGLKVEVPAELVYPGTDCIPSGPAQAVSGDRDLRRLRDVPWGLDDLWTGLSSRQLTLIRPGVRVTWSFSDNCDHFVLASFSDFGAVAVEPVTMAADGFNRLEAGLPGGASVLAPGATLAVRHEFAFTAA